MKLVLVLHRHLSAVEKMAFLGGLLLGLSMILPIGPQNVFVLTQGLVGGLRRGLLAAAVTGICDTVLILAGGAGVAALLSTLPILQAGLLWVGTVFLLYCGIRSLLPDKQPSAATLSDRHTGASGLTLVTAGIGVSWGNPHAILDTVVILGSAIAAQSADHRTPFAAGAVTASWLFFAILATGGALLGARVGEKGRLYSSRISGVVMLLFAVMLGYKAWFFQL